jgi:hypothetical protein
MVTLGSYDVKKIENNVTAIFTGIKKFTSQNCFYMTYNYKII